MLCKERRKRQIFNYPNYATPRMTAVISLENNNFINDEAVSVLLSLRCPDDVLINRFINIMIHNISQRHVLLIHDTYEYFYLIFY